MLVVTRKPGQETRFRFENLPIMTVIHSISEDGEIVFVIRLEAFSPEDGTLREEVSLESVIVVVLGNMVVRLKVVARRGEKIRLGVTAPLEIVVVREECDEIEEV